MPVFTEFLVAAFFPPDKFELAMNFMPIDINLLNAGQTIWLALAALFALALAWMTLRLVIVGLKWTFVAGLLFVAASPFLQPIDDTMIRTQLPKVQAHATEVFQKLGNETQKIALYAYNEISRSQTQEPPRQR